MEHLGCLFLIWIKEFGSLLVLLVEAFVGDPMFKTFYASTQFFPLKPKNRGLDRLFFSCDALFDLCFGWCGNWLRPHGITSTLCMPWIFAPKKVSIINPPNTLEPPKNTSYFPLYWLFNRDPYNGLLQSPYNWVVCHPLILYTLNDMFFFIAQGVFGDMPNQRHAGKQQQRRFPSGLKLWLLDCSGISHENNQNSWGVTIFMAISEDTPPPHATPRK